MREMVLNHASIRVDRRQRDEVVGWLVGLAEGMAKLIECSVVQSALRMVHSPHEIVCTDGHTLFHAYNDLRREGNREEFLFFIRLTSKLPLLQDVAPDIRERFLGCEGLNPPQEDGEPLLLCALADWISISFPSQPDWDRGKLTVRFRELRQDGSLAEATENAENVARPSHARQITEQHKRRLLVGSNPRELWENRQAVFPTLTFGPGVEENLIDAAGLFSVIVGKLVLIGQSANEWLDAGGPAPDWKTRVTRESITVRNNPTLLAARRFSSQTGDHQLFEWHARYGNNGRIHLRFDSTTREVEIGYIGPHLPL